MDPDLKHASRSAFVGAFYRPPTSNKAYVENLRASLEKIPVQNNVWLLGDFNLPDIEWYFQSVQALW